MNELNKRRFKNVWYVLDQVQMDISARNVSFKFAPNADHL